MIAARDDRELELRNSQLQSFIESRRSTHVAQNPSNVDSRRATPDVSPKDESTDGFGITDSVERSMGDDRRRFRGRGGAFDVDARARGGREVGALTLQHGR